MPFNNVLREYPHLHAYKTVGLIIIGLTLSIHFSSKIVLFLFMEPYALLKSINTIIM